MPLQTGSWRCCSGRGSTTALGMRITCEYAAENEELDVGVGNRSRVSGQRAVCAPFDMTAQPPPCRLRVDTPSWRV